MSAFPREPPEVPMPDGTGVKEVYAFFGLCAYQSQVLERGLMNLAVGLHAKGLSAITREAVEAMFDHAERKTLGQLLADVRRRVPVSAELETKLDTALRERNYLSHRFFSERDKAFCTDAGRASMIQELRDITLRLQDVDDELLALTLPLWASIGITQDMLEREIGRMLAEAGAHDAPS